MTYSEKLRDPRWQKKRAEICAAANWTCEDCGLKEGESLQVHHAHYIKGNEPWDYPQWLLHCLCNDCHVKRQKTEEDLKIGMMRMLRHVPECRLRMLVWHFIGESMAHTQKQAESENQT